MAQASFDRGKIGIRGVDGVKDGVKVRVKSEMEDGVEDGVKSETSTV